MSFNDLNDCLTIIASFLDDRDGQNFKYINKTCNFYYDGLIIKKQVKYSKVKDKLNVIGWRITNLLVDVDEQIDFTQIANLIHLTVKDNSNFNQPVDNLPPNITHLSFGYYFNQPVDKLPQNITHLTFREAFNQLVDKLPPNITHLTFGEDFNQLVDKLPPNITHFTFGNGFNQLIDKLPKA